MPEIGTVGRSQALPLSFAQQRVWFLDQLEPGSSAYNLPLAVRLTGKLEIEVLERSVREIVQRHEILRTVFDEQQGEPVQVILPRGGSELIYEDLRGMREKEAQARLRVQQQAERPFDLRHGPLVRIALLQLDEQEHILLLTLHHIIADGWSLSIFLREITRCYEAFTQSKPVLLPPMPIQYADFAVWQRGWLQGKVLEEQLTYWRRQLHGAVAVELPTDHPRLAMQGSRGARYSFTIPTDLRDALINLGHEEKVTLFMTLLTAFQILLYRYTGQEDIVVGTDIANRNRAEIEDLIGFFVNLLALRTTLCGKATFREMLKQVREIVLGAYTHQDIPFDMAIDNLRLERRPNQTPLVNILFVLQNVPLAERELPGLNIHPFEIEKTTSKFDVAFFMFEGNGELRGSVNYSTDLFNASTIQSMVERFKKLLQSIVAQPEGSIDTLEIYTEEEKMLKEEQEKMLLQANKQDLMISKGEEIDLTTLFSHALDQEKQSYE